MIRIIKRNAIVLAALGVLFLLYIVFGGSSTPTQGFSFKNAIDLLAEEKERRVVDIDRKTEIDIVGNTSKRIAVAKDTTLDDSDDDVVALAKKVSKFNGMVLVTMINYAYLSFTYSWLCNTKDMNVHKSVLIITIDKKSKESLQRDWPEISVVAMEILNVGGDQAYSHVGYLKIMVRRTEIIDAIVQADIEVFLFEFDCLWFANPVPGMQKITGVDILVNPVSQRKDVYNGGLLYLKKTEKGRKLWKELTNQMQALGRRIWNSGLADDKPISQEENDQQYLSRLVTKRYAELRAPDKVSI